MRGFTLFELLVVLGIMALIMTLAVPQFSQALPGVEFRRAAKDFATTLRVARSEAITNNRTVRVLLPAGVVEFVQGDGGAVADSVEFFPDGSSSGGVFTLNQAERELSIAIDWLTGAVRIQE